MVVGTDDSDGQFAYALMSSCVSVLSHLEQCCLYESSQLSVVMLSDSESWLFKGNSIGS